MDYQDADDGMPFGGRRLAAAVVCSKRRVAKGLLGLVLWCGIAAGASAADLQITDLSDSASDPTPAGGIVVYDITIENSASDTANNVITIFDLPAGTSAVNLPAFCAADAGVPTRIACDNGTLVGTLNGGSPVSFQLQVDTAGHIPGTIIVRSAVGRSPAPPATTPITSLPPGDPFYAGDTNVNNNAGAQTTTLTNAGDLQLQKTATPNPVVAGGEVTYALAVTNNGPSPSTNFNVVDTLPSGVSFVAGSATGAGWTFSGANGTFAGALAVGATATYTFRGKVNAASGTVVNSAQVNAVGTPDPILANNIDDVGVAIVPGADLEITKTASPTPAVSGQPITFTIITLNRGPNAAADVSFSDTMPAGFLITGGTQPAGWTCTTDPGQTTRACSRSTNYPSGATDTFTIQATVPSSGTGSSGDQTNTASITSTTADPVSANNNGSVTFSVLADGSDLALAKSKSPGLVAVWSGVGPDDDSRMTSTIQVSNLGPRSATGQVEVVDTLAAGEEFLSAAAPWACTAASAYAPPPAQQSVTCILNASALPLASGANAPPLSLITRARAAGTLTNNACTGGSGGSQEPLTDGGLNTDPNTTNDCNGAGVRTTDARADLGIAKQTNGAGTADNTLPTNYTSFTYTLTVSNTGPDGTAGVVVNDPIPGFINGRTTATAIGPAGWTCTIPSGSVICRSGATVLGPGATETIVVTVNAPILDSASRPAGTCGGAAMPAGAWCNTAGIGVDAAIPGAVGEINSANNSASDFVRIPRVANVQTTAKVITSGAMGQEGVNSTYRMDYRNQGPSAAPGVIFRDVITLPANDGGFVLISANRNGGGGTACAVTAGAGVTTAPAAGGTSYFTPGASGTVTVVCTPLNMSNGQTNSLTVVVRPNNNPGGSVGRQFTNVADFSFAGASNGTDALGDFDYNTNPSAADDQKNATLTFSGSSVDLITNKVDTGFAGGVDPLGYDPGNPSANVVTYRVTVRNQGPSVANNVRIADTLAPAAGRTVNFLGTALAAVGPLEAPGRCAIVTGTNPTVGAPLTLGCQMPGAGFGSNLEGVVGVGATSTLYLRFEYQTAPGATGDTLVNSAAATSDESDTDPNNNVEDETTSIRARADVAVSKKMVLATPAPSNDPNVALPPANDVTAVTIRQPFYYVIEGINNGPGSSLSLDRSGSNPLNGNGTVLTDTLPAGVLITGPGSWQKVGPTIGGDEVPVGTGSCTQAGSTVTCNVGDLTFAPGNGGRVRILLPARWDTVPAGGTSNNTAQVQTQQIDNVPGNNTTTVPLPVTASSIAGTVFVDRDRNGANGGVPQSPATEPRIAGVSLTLTGTDRYGNPVSLTTTTDANGDYSFANLAPSNAAGYTITETQPSGYATGPVDPPTSGANAPSLGGIYASGAPNSSYTTIVVGASDAGVRYNFPELTRSNLSGFVYVDNNLSNVRNPGTDAAIPNATVELLNAATGAVIATTTTDANGFYQFSDLDPNIIYTLREALPSGPYTNRPSAVNAGQINGAPCASGCTPGTGIGGDAATTDRISQIDLSGSDGTEFNFGEAPSGSSLSGRVWLDTNNNGVIDGGEAGIGGVSVTLTGTDDDGNPVNLTTTTAADGTYSFPNLLPGTYTVTEPTQPPNTLNGITVPGSRGGTATSPGTTPSAISTITLGINQSSTDNNFGETPQGSIGGKVYFDNDNDGVVDGGESGITGVNVVLTGTDDLGNPVNITVVTDGNGGYTFPNLRPGTYAVTEPTQPPGTTNGITNPGTIGGTPTGTATPPATTPSAISNIVLIPGANSIDNNFGEIGDSPDLVVSKSSDPAKFTVNNAGTYTIRVRNIGNRATTGGYTVEDRLPNGLTLSATPSGNNWTCTGAIGANRFACTSSVAIATGTTRADTITVRVNVSPAAVSPVNNAVLVEGGGEDASHRPTPAQRTAFEGDVTGLPVCDPAITQNACRLPTPVQLAASVSGTVWFDIGSDDVLLDGGDRRLDGWIVELVDPATGQVVRTTTTGADGSYRIPNLVPGIQYNIRFRDPTSQVLWGLPVSGETSTGPVAPCDTAGAIARGTASSCRTSTGGTTQLEVVLAPGQNLPQQSLPIDPSGVVYDAVTRDPVPGSVVTLTPVGVCTGYDPSTSILNAGSGGYTLSGSSVSMTVGSNGFYQFLFAPSAPARCQFQLAVTPPGTYLFQSTLIPPETNPLSPPGAPGTTYQVQPNTDAPTAPVGTGTTYYLDFFGGSGTPGVVHNHIPLDPAVAPGLAISKMGDRQTAEVGDTLLYTITIRQTAGAALQTVDVVDRLPPGFTYIPGTARANGAGVADPLGKPGPTLAFNAGPIAVGGQIVLNYRVRIGVGSQQGDGINRAQAFGCSIVGGCVDTGSLQPRPGTLSSNRAQYRVRVTGGVFTDEGCVLGKIYMDCNVNHMQDREELGIPGVRLYFEDGTWMVSDSEGKYSYCGLPPQSHTLKVDSSTLPLGAKLTTSSNRNLGDADSLFIDLKNGELHRADFIEGSCSNPVIEQVKARRTQGEIRAPETEPEQKPLRFESKPLRSPQQGTDSSNQRPIVDPRPTPASPARKQEGRP